MSASLFAGPTVDDSYLQDESTASGESELSAEPSDLPSCSDEAWDIAMHAASENDRLDQLGFASVDELGAYVDDVMARPPDHVRFHDGARLWRDGDTLVVQGGGPADTGTVFRMSPDPDSYWARETRR